MKKCSLCGGPVGLLGVLGSLSHYVCRDCGAQFSKRKTRKPMTPATPIPTTRPRLISDIAVDITRDWKNVFYGAVPYLDAMRQLGTVDDQFYEDSGRSVVAYFLGNATRWTGEKAREIKAELKALLKNGGSRG